MTKCTCGAGRAFVFTVNRYGSLGASNYFTCGTPVGEPCVKGKSGTTFVGKCTCRGAPNLGCPTHGGELGKANPEPSNDAEPEWLTSARAIFKNRYKSHSERAGNLLLDLVDTQAATIRSSKAELADTTAILEAEFDNTEIQKNRALQAESERDALADQLAAVVDAVMVIHPPDEIIGVEKTECRICGISRNTSAFEHALPGCPIPNLPTLKEIPDDK